MNARKFRSRLTIVVAAALLLTWGPSHESAGAQPSEREAPAVPAAMPGAPAFSSETRVRLERELAERPASYTPRTRNLRTDGAPRFTNRLLLEASPYLQQHAHNPVNWYPWGEEAFATAKALDRPVLVSIGYSTCHWCHVMEEESFDDVATATFLNEHFIAVKVDREARPDVDAIYMAGLHATGQRGGWPLNVWMTPERQPFFGGTYFPPVAHSGRPSFMQVLEGIERQYDAKRGQIDEAAEELAAAIRENLEGQGSAASEGPGEEALQHAWAQTRPRVDRAWGGVGAPTKFPSNTPLRFLLRYHHRTGDEEALRLATITLEKMAEGGIHDHLGGGFHRYSTDAKWLVPHFEKMLYDNALLATAYLEAGQLAKRDDFFAVCKSILDYVAREMTAPQGGFYSATDADSLSERGEAEEGWFFTWTAAEIEAVLGKDSDLTRAVVAYYGVTPTGDYEGRNIFHTRREQDDIARELQRKPEVLEAVLAEAREKLFRARAARPPPLRDDKILVAWNGLMISAFARAGLTLNEARYVTQAKHAADFILSEMRAKERLVRVSLAGRAGGPPFLEDYAFFIAGLLDVYEASGEPRWLREAVGLQKTLDRGYADEKGGGYYKTASDHEVLLAREKPGEDGAIPSGNSVAALNLLRLAELTGDDGYNKAALEVFAAFSELLSNHPIAVSEMLVALDFHLSQRVEVVLLSPASGEGLDAMLEPVRGTFFPNRVLSVATEGEGLADHGRLNPLLRRRAVRGGTTTAYLCKDRVCDFPTADPATFAKQLRDAVSPSRER